MKAFVISLLWGIIFSYNLNCQAQDYYAADSVAALYPDYSLLKLDELTAKLTTPFESDELKFRAIFKWIADNIKSDYYLFNQNSKKRLKLKNDSDALKKWNQQLAPRVLDQLIKHHATLCTGYSYLLKEMAMRAGIECVIINGYGRSVTANIGGEGVVNHSWNAVNFNGDWYLCDPTWAAGYIDAHSKAFVKDFNEGYYLTVPQVFLSNHYPQDIQWMDTPVGEPNLEQFLNATLVYRAAMKYNYLFNPESVFVVNLSKNNPLLLTYQFGDNAEELDESHLSIEIVHVGSNNLVAIDKPKLVGKMIEYKANFTHRGTYLLHLKANGEYLATNKIKVTK